MAHHTLWYSLFITSIQVTKLHVIGTAGHVDHGKSTLVQALTGIDPDRLSEEKERGITIDLGFAWLSLEDGREVSIVDVPGHEKFVNNMLAGVGSIDLALLVVAADESVMPQTKEHLAILDLLKIQRGIVALTKCDIVDQDWIELVNTDVTGILENTSLEGSPIISVSAKTGEGLSELKSEMNNLLNETETREDLGRPRLPIDRSFTMPGFGTVVTGTLIDGCLNIGQEMELIPSQNMTRIRGLQTHRQKLDHVTPGSRVAANITGISPNEITRGDVLSSKGWLKPTSALDVNLKVISESPNPIRHNMFVTVHTGSGETISKVRLLEKEVANAGESTFAQLKLENRIAALRGDHFIIRSNGTTLGGGKIIDSYAKRHRRRHSPTIKRLADIENGSEKQILLKTLEFDGYLEFEDLIRKANVESKIAQNAIQNMLSEKELLSLDQGAIKSETYIFTINSWNGITEKTITFLDHYHQLYPLRQGPPKEELRSRLNIDMQIFNQVVERLQQDGTIKETGPIVQKPNHTPRFSCKENIEANKYIALLKTNPYSPPTDHPIDQEVLNLLISEGKVVKVNESVVFAKSVYDNMLASILSVLDKRGEVTVGDIRDLFGSSRKYSLALLEYLDQKHITRRVGDTHILRESI